MGEKAEEAEAEPTFEVLCCEDDGSEAIICDEGTDLRRDFLSFPSHHEQLAHSPVIVSSTSSMNSTSRATHRSMSSHIGSKSSWKAAIVTWYKLIVYSVYRSQVGGYLSPPAMRAHRPWNIGSWATSRTR